MLKNIFLFFLVYKAANPDKFGKPGCLLYNGTCVEECPEYMHKVDSACDGFRCLLGKNSQQTCSEPTAVVMGTILDSARCDCDFPLVLHLPSGYCYAFDDCPRE